VRDIAVGGVSWELDFYHILFGECYQRWWALHAYAFVSVGQGSSFAKASALLRWCFGGARQGNVNGSDCSARDRIKSIRISTA